MGISPALSWPTIFFGLFETYTNLGFYFQFIDDVVNIWILVLCPISNKILWDLFKNEQQWHWLQWTFETPSLSVNFMNLIISVVNRCLETTLYEKPQNLYLYLPPHSAHHKGIKTGLIFGQILL
ncbi:hypothetical protein ACHAW6_004930 [Cyclotella cf. meneghiniana]